MCLKCHPSPETAHSFQPLTRGVLVLLSAETQGVTLGAIQTSTAVSHPCLVRDRENGINHGYGMTWVSYDACKDIGILQLADKETLS